MPFRLPPEPLALTLYGSFTVAFLATFVFGYTVGTHLSAVEAAENGQFSISGVHFVCEPRGLAQ